MKVFASWVRVGSITYPDQALKDESDYKTTIQDWNLIYVHGMWNIEFQ